MANEVIISSNEMVAPPAALIDASLRLPPRDMVAISNQMVAMVCSSPEVARAAIYCVPVGKDKETGLQKFTLGESIRMAEIAQGAFGRLMVDIKIEGKTAPAGQGKPGSVTVKAMALDLQTLNIYPGLGTASIFNEAREKLAIQAASSIARRNAILSMVKPYTQAILPQIKATIVKGLSEKGSVTEALEMLTKEFEGIGVTKAQIKQAMSNVKDKVDWVVMLIGILNGIRDHMYSAADVFAPQSSKPEVEIPRATVTAGSPAATDDGPIIIDGQDDEFTMAAKSLAIKSGMQKMSEIIAVLQKADPKAKDLDSVKNFDAVIIALTELVTKKSAKAAAGKK